MNEAVVKEEVVNVVNEVDEGDDDGGSNDVTDKDREGVVIVLGEAKLVGDSCGSCILTSVSSSVVVSVESTRNGANSPLAIVSMGEISLGIYHHTR